MLQTQQARIFTAVMLTGILSVGSGFVHIKNAHASSVNFLVENPHEIVKQNPKSNSLPRDVADAVLEDISSREKIAINKLKITNYSRQTWRNGCLELAQTGEICTQALVPGWRVVVTHGKQKWVYHTNNTGSILRLKENNNNTLRPVPIPASELPPTLDRNMVFREISSGGFAGRTYETVLMNDGTLIRVRIGDANDSERSVRRVTREQVRQFQRIINREQNVFRNVSYPAPGGAADFITYTLTSRRGTVQYNDISRDKLPKDVQTVVKAWSQLVSTAK